MSYARSFVLWHPRGNKRARVVIGKYRGAEGVIRRKSNSSWGETLVLIDIDCAVHPGETITVAGWRLAPVKRYKPPVPEPMP